MCSPICVSKSRTQNMNKLIRLYCLELELEFSLGFSRQDIHIWTLYFEIKFIDLDSFLFLKCTTI